MRRIGGGVVSMSAERVCKRCGASLDGRNRRAVFCSGRCRAAWHSGGGGKVAEVAPIRSGDGAGGSVAASAAALAPDVDLVAAVRRTLADAGKSGWRVEHAISVAVRLATPMEAGAAGLSKELDRLMGDILADVRTETDELDAIHDELAARRSRRRA